MALLEAASSFAGGAELGSSAGSRSTPSIMWIWHYGQTANYHSCHGLEMRYWDLTFASDGSWQRCCQNGQASAALHLHLLPCQSTSACCVSRLFYKLQWRIYISPGHHAAWQPVFAQRWPVSWVISGFLVLDFLSPMTSLAEATSECLNLDQFSETIQLISSPGLWS